MWRASQPTRRPAPGQITEQRVDRQSVATEQVRAHAEKLAEYEARRAEMGASPDPLGLSLTLEAGIAHERVWVQYWEQLAGSP